LLKFGVGRACGYHARILAAIAAHEPEAARGAMRRHLIAALGDLS
jgi:DNA-binding FadR family transcriptional regulator